MKQIYMGRESKEWELYSIKVGEDNTQTSLKSLFIDHIGIHAAPGATFSINGAGSFRIGASGIFEINLEGKHSYITSIECSNNKGHFVLIDLSGQGV